MQSTNSEYGSPYLAVCHRHFKLETAVNCMYRYIFGVFSKCRLGMHVFPMSPCCGIGRLVELMLFNSNMANIGLFPKMHHYRKSLISVSSVCFAKRHCVVLPRATMLINYSQETQKMEICWHRPAD